MKRTKGVRKKELKQTEEKVYTFTELRNILSERWKKFCHKYVIDYNRVKAYREVYGMGLSSTVASVNADRLLKNAKIQQYISYIRDNIAEEVGISKIMFLKELKQIALAKLPDAYTNWITRKELETLKEEHPELIVAIKEINTKVIQSIDTYKEPIEIEYVKITLHDKNTAIEKIFKAMGWNEPDKFDLRNDTTVNLGTGNVQAIREAFGLNNLENPL